MKRYFMKSLIATAFSFGLCGNVLAECNSMPYVAPEELQPACEEKALNTQDTASSSANKAKQSQTIDDKSKFNPTSLKQFAVKQLSQTTEKLKD